ncbi:MAG: hypothetical protein ONB17_11370 [candidate division KSB1 bacterium]|nr:hypothetical protein [candidate division KSB1 bacterium]
MNAYFAAAIFLLAWLTPLVVFFAIMILRWGWRLGRFAPYVAGYSAVTTSVLAILFGVRGFVLIAIVILSILGPWYGWKHYAAAWAEGMEERERGRDVKSDRS